MHTTLIFDGPGIAHLATHVWEERGGDLCERFIDYVCSNLPEGPRQMHVAWGWEPSNRRVEARRGYRGAGYDTAIAEDAQMVNLREILSQMGIDQHENTGAESRDIVAHLCGSREGPTILHSSDRSLLGLIDDATVVRDPYTGKTWDRWAVRDEYGVDPEKLADLLALLGEPILGVEGVNGIPRGRLASALKKGGNLGGLYEDVLSELGQRDKARLTTFRNVADQNRTVLEFETLNEMETTEGVFDADGIRTACAGCGVNADDLVTMVQTHGFARTNDASQLH